MNKAPFSGSFKAFQTRRILLMLCMYFSQHDRIYQNL